MGLDERALFTDKSETRPGRYACPKCKRTNDYSIRWVKRTKKDRLPPGADDVDRAKFAKLRDYMLRLDDDVTCKTCGKKFEIPSLHSLLFVDQLEGLPRDVEDDEPAPPSSRPSSPAGADRPGERNAPDRRGPRRMTTPPRGWRG